MRCNRYLSALISCLTLFFILSTDGIAQEYTIHVGKADTSAYPDIAIYVNVTDSEDEQVVNLEQDDFVVTEDGTAVDLIDFAGVTESRPVDVVFVFDTTGSMSEEIDGLKETSVEFANQLRENNRDFRLGLISFSDKIEGQYNADGSLTDDENEFRRWVSRLRADGGNDTPENAFGAIKAASEMDFREDAQIIFILITDAPPHRYGDGRDSGVRFDDPDLTIDRILTLLEPDTIMVYPVAYNDDDYRQIARETGGKFYDIERDADFTDIIDEIGETIASQYKLTYRSPRPTYDGTRRDILVSMGSGREAATGSTDYLEEHLLNIQSSWLIGLILAIPLAVALLLPHYILPRMTTVSGKTAVYSPPLPPIYQPPLSHCPNCQMAVRSGARFCNHCRHELILGETAVCPQCQLQLRKGAHFCAACGYKV